MLLHHFAKHKDTPQYTVLGSAFLTIFKLKHITGRKCKNKGQLLISNSDKRVLGRRSVRAQKRPGCTPAMPGPEPGAGQPPPGSAGLCPPPPAAPRHRSRRCPTVTPSGFVELLPCAGKEALLWGTFLSPGESSPLTASLGSGTTLSAE